MSCMTRSSTGCACPSRIPRRSAFRAGVIEWLMVNHPHDCPICDEGGECHLQDMTVMTGHVYRRYRFDKRDASQPGPRPVHQPRDEPLHPVLPLRPLLPRLRGRATTSTSWAGTTRCIFGRADGRDAREPVQRQPLRGLPHRRLHRQDLKPPTPTRKWDLQTALRSARTAAWAATPCPASATASSARAPALQRRRQRLLHLRPGPLRLELRRLAGQARPAASFAHAQAPRARPGGGRRSAPRCGRLGPSAQGPRRSASARPAPRSRRNFALRSLVGAGALLPRRLRRGVRDPHADAPRSRREGPARLRRRATGRGVGRRHSSSARTSGTRRRSSPCDLRKAATNAPSSRGHEAEEAERLGRCRAPRSDPAEKGPLFIATVEPTKLDDMARE